MLPLGFLKMLMSDDAGDKVIQILIGVLAVVIVCFAWWTTNISEQPHYRTVFLLDRRLRRRTNRSRLTTHIQSTSIVGGIPEEEVTATGGDNQANENTQASETNKPPEASTSSDTSTGGGDTPPLEDTSSNIEEEELATIVQIMDADANVVRLRRLAYYENQQRGDTNNDANASQATTSTEQSDINNRTSNLETNSQPNSSTNSLEDASEERVEIVHEPIMEHNYAEREPLHINPTNKDNSDNLESVGSGTSSGSQNSDSNIRIKLKYLNDELKLVDGRLEEQLGDFKRRHFHPEFSTNKLVRLIFNGQVLQPDTETLQSCGLFDNCVVHCLVHQQRNVFNDATNTGSGFASNTARTAGIGLSQSNNNNNQGRDWDLGNALLIFVSIILGTAWYFRYEYAHLYTVTATVALVAITGIFTVFLVGVYFPDPVPSQPQVERQAAAT